jgi:flagellar secretion chaperone FliS
MFGSTPNGAKAYSQVGVETGVVAANPHKLIVMLFDGAIAAVRNAGEQMKAGDIAAKGASISKAISIIDGGLRASLDKTAGGEVAANLDALYEYMMRRLLTANLQNKQEMLDEVQRLLQDLKTAWEAIGAEAKQPAEVPKPAPAYDDLTPRSTTFVSA